MTLAGSASTRSWSGRMAGFAGERSGLRVCSPPVSPATPTAPRALSLPANPATPAARMRHGKTWRLSVLCGRAGVCRRAFRETPRKRAGISRQKKFPQTGTRSHPHTRKLTIRCPCPAVSDCEAGTSRRRRGTPRARRVVIGQGTRRRVSRHGTSEPVGSGRRRAQSIATTSVPSPSTTTCSPPSRPGICEPSVLAVSDAPRISRFLLSIVCGIPTPEWSCQFPHRLLTPQRHREG
jgi:hypothetical protein